MPFSFLYQMLRCGELRKGILLVVTSYATTSPGFKSRSGLKVVERTSAHPLRIERLTRMSAALLSISEQRVRRFDLANRLRLLQALVDAVEG